ncbi:hypothetical protein V8F06_013278 [Rhypophila decipiens]
MATSKTNPEEQIPIIDISPYLGFLTKEINQSSTALIPLIQQVHSAASTWGFFLLTHSSSPAQSSISPQTQDDFLASMKSFFSLPQATKSKYDVHGGGIAWRGYMPLGGEHTHGGLDYKEGLYVGAEHPDDHPLINMPLHGKNRMPEDDVLPGMKKHVLRYLNEASELGKTLTDIFSLALGFEKDYLRHNWIEPEPVLLLRCFKYMPPEESQSAGQQQLSEGGGEGFGIGGHTDFGYLTILKSDQPGLQILSPSNKWVDVPHVENSFIINIGDMFDQLTNGRYRSRPHRALRPKPGSPPRYSFPLFFDFAWNAEMKRLPLDHLPPLTEEEKELARKRWAATTFREVKGTWSQYLARKVQKVFPDLRLPDFEGNAAPSTRFTRVVEARPGE